MGHVWSSVAGQDPPYGRENRRAGLDPPLHGRKPTRDATSQRPVPAPDARSARSGFVARDDEPLDLRGALVDLGDLGVSEITLERHLLRVTHAAVDLHRLVGD